MQRRRRWANRRKKASAGGGGVGGEGGGGGGLKKYRKPRPCAVGTHKQRRTSIRESGKKSLFADYWGGRTLNRGPIGPVPGNLLRRIRFGYTAVEPRIYIHMCTLSYCVYH